eukprot:232723-Chlamydomonas_euryale.AAC.1
MRGSRNEWTRAIQWYRAAASVLPSSGNPYNQLAVMSYQTGDELRAVYFYFRRVGCNGGVWIVMGSVCNGGVWIVFSVDSGVQCGEWSSAWGAEFSVGSG